MSATTDLGAAVLSILFTHPEIDAKGITADHFPTSAAKICFKTYAAQKAQGLPTDQLSIIEKLRADGNLDKVGGAAYIAGLTSSPALPSSFDYYRNQLIETYRKAQGAKYLKLAAEAVKDGESWDSAYSRLSLQMDDLKTDIGNGRKLQFTRIGDYPESQPDWLVKHYIERDSTLTFFSPPGGGKTAALIHISCCITTGHSFNGQKTKKGRVFFFIGEGLRGLKRRIRAWCLQYGYRMEELDLFVASAPLSLTNPEEMARIRAEAAEAAKEIGAPDLIVIDTLARNFGGGDENSTLDMNRAILEIDRLRIEYGCAVAIAHHTSKADRGKARGNGALLGAMDYEYQILKEKNDPTVRMLCTKNKESETSPPAQFRLTGLPVDWDEDGQEITAVVCVEEDYTEPEKNGGSKKTGATGKCQVKAVEILEQLYSAAEERLVNSGYDPDTAQVSKESWIAALKAQDMSRQRISDIQNKLQEKKIITIDGGGYVFFTT